MISACAKVHHEKAIPKDAYLETPSGQYPFRSITAEQATDLGLRNYHGMYLLAESTNVKVLISTAGNMRIASNLDGKITIQINDSTYSHLNESTKAIAFNQSTTSGYLRNKWIDSSENFKYAEIPIVNIDTSDEIHHFTIPFSISDISFNINAPIKVEKIATYEHKISVPGTP